jgi:SAM-dependent methyltransferase
MNQWLFQTWQELNDRTIGTEHYWWIALQNADFYRDMQPLIARHVQGRTLDLGAGKLAWRNLLKEHCTSYTSGDLLPVHPELDIVLDITQPLPFADAAFDTLFCCSVLEHVPEPWQTLAEMRRILSSQGKAIIAVPFLFYLHGQPHDYFRFTHYGIIHLANQAGWRVVEIVPCGSFFHLLLNPLSLICSIIWARLKLYYLIYPTTYCYLKLSRILNHLFKDNGLYTMSYILVLKPNEGK